MATEARVPGLAVRTGAAPAWIDFAGSQAAWWGCVLLARAGRESSALSGPVLYVTAHAVLRSGRRKRLLALAAFAVLAGWVGDTVLVRAGLISFPGAAALSCSPPWMAGLWAAFAVSLTASLARLVRQPIAVAAALGAIAGPLAYVAGERLGALALGPSSVPAVAAEWAVATPLLVLCARRVLAAERRAGAAR